MQNRRKKLETRLFGFWGDLNKLENCFSPTWELGMRSLFMKQYYYSQSRIFQNRILLVNQLFKDLFMEYK